MKLPSSALFRGLPLALGLLVLAACKPEPAGEPVIRTEIGKGEVKTAQPAMPKAAPSPSPSPSSCQAVEFEKLRLTDCVADPARHRIAVVLGKKGGAPYRSFAAYAGTLGDKAANIAFAMNGGMFDGVGKPVGYYVENGERLHELNRNDGPGNFHMKPNGVFFGNDDKWRVLSADAFYASVGERPQFGTQSGPMLLIDGQLHPEISDDGPSRTVRNAVGVDADGKAHFVISEAPVSFGLMARYFRDQVKARNALYLDGAVSGLWDPASGRIDNGAPLGPLIVVTNRQNGAQ